MKKHLLGFLIFLIAFGIGFWFSPIRFSSFAFGSCSHGSYIAFNSTDFEKLSLTKERYDSIEETTKSFEDHKREFQEIIILEKHYDYVYQDILVSENNRALVSYRTESGLKGYCSYRREETRIFEICSPSFRHVLEFEKQYFPK